MSKCTMKSTKGFSNVISQVKFINFKDQVAVFDWLAGKNKKTAGSFATEVKPEEKVAEVLEIEKKTAPKKKKTEKKAVVEKETRSVAKKPAKKTATKKTKTKKA